MKKPKILITGASKGIGLALAQRLANDYHLILHASKEENLQHCPDDASKLCADFADNNQLSEFCSSLKKEHGDDLYAVINNAGLTFDKSLIFQPERDIDTLLQVNLKAPIMISKVAMKLFNAKKKGVIINVSSVVGQKGNAFQAVYAATKAGLIGLSKSLAQEAAALNNDGHEIRVLSIAPGFIETNMTAILPEAEKQKYLQFIPSRRFGKAEDVAETVAFLLSTTSSYINGSTIDLNGGL